MMPTELFDSLPYQCRYGDARLSNAALAGHGDDGANQQIFHNIGQLGLICGVYMVKALKFCNFYQLSNQVTLGLSEEEICHNLTLVTRQIIEQERRVRETQSGMAYQLRDRIGRT